MHAYERLVLRAMMDKDGRQSVSGLVSEDIFQDNKAQALYTILERMHAETAGDITSEELGMELDVVYGNLPDRRREFEQVAEEVCSATLVDRNALQRRVRSLLSHNYMREAVQYMAEHIHEPDIDPHVPLALIQKAADIHARIGSDIISLENVGLEGVGASRPGLISTGCSEDLDLCLKGGVAAGELMVWLGSTGRGKSSFLTMQGANAALAGKSVLHFTLEMSLLKTASRYNQALTGLTPTQMRENKPAVQSAWDRVREAGGRIEIIDWSGQQDVTVDDIHGAVQLHKTKGHRVDVIAIDYLGLLRSMGKQKEVRHQYERIVQDARQMGNALGVPVITAWQANRAASDAHVTKLENLAESSAIGHTADIVISLNQNVEEKANKHMRLYICKQRETGLVRTIPVYADLDDRLVIRDICSDPVQEANKVIGNE